MHQNEEAALALFIPLIKVAALQPVSEARSLQKYIFFFLYKDEVKDTGAEQEENSARRHEGDALNS